MTMTTYQQQDQEEQHKTTIQCTTMTNFFKVLPLEQYSFILKQSSSLAFPGP